MKQNRVKRGTIRFLIAAAAFSFLPAAAFAQTIHHVGRMDRIEMIEGKPARKFVRLGPVWATDATMEGAMKKIRRQAAKLKADAVIEVKVTTETGEAKGGTAEIDPEVKIELSGVTQPQPVVQGWAVKWVAEPSLEI